MVYILAVSDENELYDNPVDFPRIDMLLSCGDLSPHYLGFLIDKYMPAIRIMVHGNHDENFFLADQNPVNLQYSEIFSGMFSIVQGIHTLQHNEYPFLEQDLVIAGFSGISAYGNPPFYFSDSSLLRFKASLLMQKYLSSFSGVDIMLTHAPPDFGLITNVSSDHKPSEELASLKNILDPKLWLYGHVHRRYTSADLDFLVEDGAQLNLVNACPYKYISYDQKTGQVVLLNSGE